MTVNSVAAGVIVARWLGADGVGALAVINVSVAIAAQVSNLGLPSANTYFIAQDERRFIGPATVNSILFSGVIGGLLACLLALLALREPGFFGNVPRGLIWIAAVSLPFQLLTLLGLNIFLAVGRISRYNALEVTGQSFVVINAVVSLVILGAGLWLLVSLNTAATIIVSLLIIWLIGRHLRQRKIEAPLRPDFALFRQMMSYGIRFHIAHLAGLLIFRADLLVVNHFRGSTEAGIYSVASQVAMMLMLLPGVIATLLFPRVAAEDSARRDQLTCRASRFTTFLMLLASIAAVPASFALPLLYGAPFADATVQFLILLPGVFLVSIESVLVQYFSGTGLPAAIPLFWLVTLALNLVLTFTLVPSFGGRGAAVASAISYSLIFALVVVYFRLKTGNTLTNILLLRREELRALLKAA